MANKQILIVDDEIALGSVLSEKLTKAGYKVAWAKNGVTGLKMAIDQKPDLILLDLIMPELDGLGLLRQLRQDDWGKTAKVIVLTNLTDPAKATEARKLGADLNIIKANSTLEDLILKIGQEFFPG